MKGKRKLTKRIAAWFLCLAMVLTTVNLPAFTTEVKAVDAQPEVHYVDANGDDAVTTDYTIISESGGDFQTIELVSGTYVVNQDVTMPATVEIKEGSTVNLVLCDGAKFTIGTLSADTFLSCKGTLNIFGQKEGTGELKLNRTANVSTCSVSSNGRINLYRGTVSSSSIVLLNNAVLNVQGGTFIARSNSEGNPAIIDKSSVGLIVTPNTLVYGSHNFLGENAERITRNSKKDRAIYEYIRIQSHTHNFANGICTECNACEAFVTQGNHNFSDQGICNVCGTKIYLTFTAEKADSYVKFNWMSGLDVQYSTDGGSSWNDYTPNTDIRLENIGDKVSFKGTCVMTNYSNHFYMKGKIAASGNVTSLTNGNGGDIALESSCYSYMFSNCTSLTNAPELPSTTLAYDCYSRMFLGCTSLTNAPELPSTTLANDCYSSMFLGCTSLTSAPELPATTLANYCYSGMFFGCTSLTSAPKLPAMTLELNCYSGMFNGCTSLTNAPELPATTLANYCYNGMFNGCTKLTVAPELSATKLEEGCYYSMFGSCTSLMAVPNLPATTLASYCYSSMFDGCTNLKVVETTDESEATWKFPLTGAANWNEYMIDGLTAPDTLTAVEAGKMYKVTHAGKHSFSDDTCQGVCVCGEKNTSGNHDFSKYISNEDGTHKVVCKNCDTVQEGHDKDACSGGTATCTKKAVCEVCGDEYGVAKNHDFSKYVSNGDGTHKVECKDCGATQEGHDNDACSGGTATCTKKAKCENCGDEYGSLADHTGGTATCKAKAKCSVCGKEYGSLAAHTYATKWSTDATNHWHACTVCEAKKDSAAHADSNKDGKCDTCSYSMQTHTHKGTKVAQVDATCTKDGVKEYYACSCGKYFTDSACTKVIADLAAWKAGDGKITKIAHTVTTTTTQATLKADGKRETKCNVCGQITKTEVIYAAKTVKLAKAAYAYDGKAKKPAVTVKDSKGNTIAKTNYSVTYATGRKKVGQYTVKITFKGDYSGTKSLKFAINPKATKINGVTPASKAFTVKWAKQTKEVSGYEIQYSTDQKFKSGVKKVAVTKNTTTSKKILGLKSKKTYYVRVRTYKKVGTKKYYSDWSAKKSVTIKK